MSLTPTGVSACGGCLQRNPAPSSSGEGAALQCPADCRVFVVPVVSESIAQVSVNGVDISLVDVVRDPNLGLESYIHVRTIADFVEVFV